MFAGFAVACRCTDSRHLPFRMGSGYVAEIFGSCPRRGEGADVPVAPFAQRRGKNLMQLRTDATTATGATLLTPAAYARLRKLNKSTVSRQIHEGKIPLRADGLINFGEADRARERNLDPAQRWEQEHRKKSKGRKKATQGVGVRTQRSEVLAVGKSESGIDESLLMAVLHTLTDPEQQRAFATTVLTLGCSPELAYWLAVAYGDQIAAAECFDVLDEDQHEAAAHPTADLSAVLGKLNFSALDEEYDRRMPAVQEGL